MTLTGLGGTRQKPCLWFRTTKEQLRKKKDWFILERRLNGQCQQPGGMQFRHNILQLTLYNSQLAKA